MTVSSVINVSLGADLSSFRKPHKVGATCHVLVFNVTQYSQAVISVRAKFLNV